MQIILTFRDPAHKRISCLRIVGTRPEDRTLLEQLRDGINHGLFHGYLRHKDRTIVFYEHAQGNSDWKLFPRRFELAPEQEKHEYAIKKFFEKPLVAENVSEYHGKPCLHGGILISKKKRSIWKQLYSFFREMKRDKNCSPAK